MEIPPHRSPNVAGMLLAGTYWYVDGRGAEELLVDVAYELGEPVARLWDAGPEDEGLELDPREMTGAFQPVTPSELASYKQAAKLWTAE